MAIKKRLKLTEKAALLADEIADKAYGEPTADEVTEEDVYVVTSISIQRSMLYQLEDLALRNKRTNTGEKNISALIRQAVANLLVNK